MRSKVVGRNHYIYSLLFFLNLERFTQHKACLWDTHEAEPLVESVCVDVVILRIEHDTQHVGSLEEGDRFGHQTSADAASIYGWMNGDPHEVAEFLIDGIELVPDHVAVEFRDDEIGMGSGNVTKRDGIIAPEVLEASGINVE